MKTILSLIVVVFGSFAMAQSPGNALHFNGSSTNVSTSLPSVFTNIPGNDFTIEAWVYPEASGFSRVLFAQLDASNFVSISMGAGNTVYFYVSNNQSANTLNTIPLNQWTHVACTWTAGMQQIEVYFNGIPQATVSGGSSSTGNNNIMTIGSRTNNAQYFPGQLDELRIWDVALTACQIQSRFNSDFTIPPSNLIAYYDFNEGVAGGNNAGVITLPDITTTYDGTLNGFTLNGTTANWVTSGATITGTNQIIGAIPGTDVQTACGPYTWIDGNSYTTNNNTATFLIAGGSTNGCDSLVTLDLTIGTTVTGTDVRTECAPFDWIDGNTYTSSNNTATFTIAGGSATGCDSIVTLDLTVLTATAGTDVQTACNSFDWIDGNTYTSSNNMATFTIAGGSATGCDSTVTLDLTINTANTATTVNGITITANASGAGFQWLDCDNGFSPIAGATMEDFTPTANGNYAVQINENGCTDTSVCVAISTIGIIENSFDDVFTVFPNPTSGLITIAFEKTQGPTNLNVYTLSGHLIKNETFEASTKFELILDPPVGMYLLELTNSSDEKAVVRIIKE